MVITGPAICYTSGATNSFAEIIGEFGPITNTHKTAKITEACGSVAADTWKRATGKGFHRQAKTYVKGLLHLPC